MKGQAVGNMAKILWPSEDEMLALREITCQDYVTNELSALDLLWPASLINEQARTKEHFNWPLLLAILGFAFSAVLAFVIGPMQMILVAAVLDYGWVTTSYYPAALNFSLITTGIITLVNLTALILSWRAQPQRTHLTLALVAGSTFEIGLIWFTSRVVTWPPHILTLALLLSFAGFLILALLISKQYDSHTKNTVLTKAILSFMIIATLAEICLSAIYLFEPSTSGSPEQIKQLAAAQEQAHLAEVTRPLSDLTYTLCGEPYQIVYASKEGNSGLFECKNSGEVYSVADFKETNGKSLRGAAIYLGTTKSTSLNLTFPNSYYLYRSLPDSNIEDELVLMLPANSEQELIDNVTTPLLDFWQTHSERSIFINIFYNNDLGAVTSTRDFVLMSALDTMSMNPLLPRGDSYKGYLDGKIVPYTYEADTTLQALNELGADPKLYADSSRIALTTHRHISLHLAAGETFDYESLRIKLQESFTGGIENLPVE